MLYEDFRITGPYKRADRRQHLVITHLPTGKKTTLSFPKYLMEMELGRYLERNETVHHIDGDVTNNDLSNLEIIDRARHGSLHAFKHEERKFVCPMCNKEFTLVGKKLSNYYRERRRRVYSGPYCSKQCADKVRPYIA